MCPLCKRTVLPSDDSEDSESEEAPLLANQDNQNDSEGSHDDNRTGTCMVPPRLTMPYIFLGCIRQKHVVILNTQKITLKRSCTSKNTADFSLTIFCEMAYLRADANLGW